jgi:hypothetical protein
MTRVTARALPLLFVFLAAWGCGEESIPTTPTPVYTTDTFTDSLAIGGTKAHTFVANTPGTATVTVVTLAPEATVFALSLGVWDGSTCKPSVASNNAQRGSVFFATVGAGGNYCMSVADVGNITADAPMEYTIQVTHP